MASEGTVREILHALWTAIPSPVAWAEARLLAEGVVQFRLQTAVTRAARFPCTPFLVDDVLVDTGFSNARGAFLTVLEHREIRAVALTHHHEDHSGNAGPLQRARGCPVYLRSHWDRLSEGVGHLLPYRRVFWGVPDLGEPSPMPEAIRTSRRTLVAIPSPGHSRTHTAFYDPDAKALFSGDLFVAPGAAAVMSEEDPYEHVRSLRAVAALEPATMYTGHGAVYDDAATRLRRKADRIEQATALAVELHDQGFDEHAIAHRVFPGGWRREALGKAMTQSEFSRENFVRLAVGKRTSER